MAPRKVSRKRSSRKRVVSRSRPRSTRVLRGSGGYYAKAGSMAGGYLGSRAGRYAGSALGGMAGSLLDGQGAYRRKTGRTAWKRYRGTNAQQAPVFYSKTAEDTLIVRGREYLRDISTSVNFAISESFLNPGVVTSYPFLAQIASQYQEYDFKQLAYYFKSQSANSIASVNTALGNVMLAVDYNIGNPTPTSKFELENLQGTVSGRPSQNITLLVECKKNLTVLNTQYIRYGQIPAGSDQRLFDMGKVYFATSGAQSSSVAGEIWVSYTCELKKRRLNGGLLNYTAQNAKYYSGTTTNISGTNIFAGLVAHPNNPMSLTFTGTNSFQFPADINAGRFLCIYKCVGAPAILPTFANVGITYTNCRSVPFFWNENGISNSPVGSNNTQILMWAVQVTDNNAGMYMGLSVSPLPATPANSEFYVINYNSLLDSYIA